MRPIAQDRWSVILAGGEGTRLRALTREIEGEERPKQFCRVMGRESLLDQTWRRSALLVPPDQTVTVLTCHQERFYAPLVAGVPGANLVCQAAARGTTAAIVYGLLRVAQRAPISPVVILPSDHYVSDSAAFMRHVAAAFDVVRARADLVVLLGIAPDAPATDYGWIEPGEQLPIGPANQLQRVRRFWEKPHQVVAERLQVTGCLWNCFVLVARVPVLLSLIRSRVPDVAKAMEGARGWIGSADETEAMAEVYGQIRASDFSEEVLAARTSNLAVLRVSGVRWSDLGSPDRVHAALLGTAPAWSERAAAPAL